MTSRQTGAAALLAASALLLASCGGGDEVDAGRTAPPSAQARDFPKPAGKTIAQMRSELGPGPVLAQSVSLLEADRRNRFGFGLFDRSRKQISQAQVALYVADARGRAVKGPYLARWETLAVKPEFQSESVTADPDAAASVYVADVPFGKPGDYQVLGVARLDDRLIAADPVAVRVVRSSKVPDVGDRAPRTHTPTLVDVGGVESKLDTRVPPAPDLHERDFADVLGKQPIVLVFATPALCQSRVCGPVVDILKQVKAQHEGEAVFIHQEIYNDNEVEKGFRQQVLAWRLPSEPWAFTVDRSGRIAARLEGAFSARELERAVRAATKG